MADLIYSTADINSKIIFPYQKITWISRHTLSFKEIKYWERVYKKIEIYQEAIRFNDEYHFLEFLKQCNHNNFFPYAVVPRDWCHMALNLNLNFGYFVGQGSDQYFQVSFMVYQMINQNNKFELKII